MTTASVSRETFDAALALSVPPSDWDPISTALWMIHHDQWEPAHDQVQAIDTPAASWVHALLHRIEGDLSNAGYWYRRAERPVASGDLVEEWGALVDELVGPQR